MKNHKLQTLSKTIITIIENKDLKNKDKGSEIKTVI